MWPFTKKKSRADLAVEWMPKAIEVASGKWLEYNRVLKFSENEPLEMKIMSFVMPLEQGLKQWEAFKDGPDAIFLLIAAKGVEKSGTHTTKEIEDALGISLPQS